VHGEPPQNRPQAQQPEPSHHDLLLDLKRRHRLHPLELQIIVTVTSDLLSSCQFCVPLKLYICKR
jgi:hypothetical protein